MHFGKLAVQVTPYDYLCGAILSDDAPNQAYHRVSPLAYEALETGFQVRIE